MRRHTLLGACSLLLTCCGSLKLAAQESGSPDALSRSDEPFVKFLDDLFCLGHVASTRNAWEERIETDRHDFTQSAVTVGRGVSQVEMGYTYFYHDEDEELEQSHTTPELMLRLGLTDDIEFRVRWTYAWQFIEESETASSAEDLRWAFKLATTEMNGLVPESALEVRFTAPTGGADFSTDRMEFGLDYIYDWKLSPGCRVYGSTGFSTNGLADFGLLPEEPADERFIVWTQSAAVGCELTERMTMYNEVFGEFSYALIDDYRIVIYNVGLDYYVTDDLVLDIRFGKGLTPDSDDFFAGVGGGVRF